MTPLEIEIVLHYYCSHTDYGRDKGGGNCPSDAPAVVEALGDLVRSGLIELSGSLLAPEPRYLIADRGSAYVEFLKEMPLPVSKWVMPE